MIRYPLEYNQILNSSKYNTFGWVRKYNDGSPRFHKGWDLQQPMGTAVFPVSKGEVVGVTYVDKPGSKYGITINLKFEHNGKKRYAFYAHLMMAMVAVGQIIEYTNIPIGLVGDTGNAKGIAADKVHLHFEFRNREQGGKGTSDRIDPVEFYGDPPYNGILYIDE
ncbi:MAG: M23 family metallopeptidase [Blastocatellia bacterium]